MMQNERGNVIRILITNLPAIIAIALMSLVLNIVLDYNFILSFIVLAIAYVVLGIIVEIVLEKISVSNRKKQPVSQVNRQPRPKVTDDQQDTQPVRKISTAPYAEYAAERLKKTKLNFNDLLVVDSRESIEKKNEETENKVTIINDYSTLLKKVKPKETPIPVTKTVSVEKINEEKQEVKEIKPVIKEKVQPAIKEKEQEKEVLFTDTSDSFEDFTVKPADALEAESIKIRNEIDKRLANDSKVTLPAKKKISPLPETFTFDKNVKDDKEEQEKPELKEIPQDLKITSEPTVVDSDIEEFNEISFTSDEVKAEDDDKAVADSELISQLYQPVEVKKKQPFWKRFFQ